MEWNQEGLDNNNSKPLLSLTPEVLNSLSNLKLSKAKDNILNIVLKTCASDVSKEAKTRHRNNQVV